MTSIQIQKTKRTKKKEESSKHIKLVNMKIVSTTITTILLTISCWSQAFTTTTSTTKAFYPTKSIGIANTRFRGSSSTELHVVDVNSLVQLSVLFGAGATVFYLGDNPMTNANASSNTEANANAFKNVSVVADLEKENSKNIGDELVADVIGEPIEALTALDEETADVIAETLVEVKEIEEVVAAVDEKKKKEEEKKKKEEEEIARKKAIEAERNADMQVSGWNQKLVLIVIFIDYLLYYFYLACKRDRCSKETKGRRRKSSKDC